MAARIAAVLFALCISGALYPAAVFSQQDSAIGISLSDVSDREVILQFTAGKRSSDVSRSISITGAVHRRTHALSYGDLAVYAVPDELDYHEVLAELQTLEGVTFAGPNVKKTASSTVLDDPLLLGDAADIQQGLIEPYVVNNQYALLLTGCVDAWDATTGNEQVVVAVLDTGINLEHEDMQGAIWVNADEIPGNEVDDDNNGFVDDVNGYDFENITASGGDSDPSDPGSDYISHGNATSSIIGARGDNSLGIAGIAGGDSETGGVKIMPLRVGTNMNIGVDAEIAAIDYAIANGAHIISMSFGGVTGGAPEENAINRAWDAGLYIVAASGNVGAGNQSGGEWLVDLPAGFENCVAVGATTIFPSQTVSGSTSIIPEEVANYSKTGPETELTAPGTHIMCAAADNSSYSGLTHQFTGTSAATPVVAGLAALLWSANIARDGSMTMTNQDIRDLMNNTALDLGAPGRDEGFGFGRIDMMAAMNEIIPVGLVGDTNSDGVVDENDIQAIRDRFGAVEGDENYSPKVDTNGDGVIDELDIFEIGRNYDDGS